MFHREIIRPVLEASNKKNNNFMIPFHSGLSSDPKDDMASAGLLKQGQERRVNGIIKHRIQVKVAQPNRCHDEEKNNCLGENDVDDYGIIQGGPDKILVNNNNNYNRKRPISNKQPVSGHQPPAHQPHFHPQIPSSNNVANVINVGDFVKDRWQIVRKIGGGGFGDIYEAVDTKTTSTGSGTGVYNHHHRHLSNEGTVTVTDKIFDDLQSRVAIKIEPCPAAAVLERSMTSSHEVAVVVNHVTCHMDDGHLKKLNDDDVPKIAATTTCKQVLKMEVFVLKRLQNKPNFCRLLGCGRNEKYSYMVMSLRGRNLAHLRRLRPNGSFSPPTVANVGLQILRALKDIHQAGFLHRDVKPSNFSVALTPDRYRRSRSSAGTNTEDEETTPPSGSNLLLNTTTTKEGQSGEADRTIYALDFGLARQYVDSFGKVRPPRQAAGFRGTVRYASLNAHRNNDLSLRDDIWSFFYVLVEFSLGFLPWRKIKDKDRVAQIKETFNFEHLLMVSNPSPSTADTGGVSISNEAAATTAEGHYFPELFAIYEYLNDTLNDYYDIPDYAYLESLLVNWRDRIGASPDTPYDWETRPSLLAQSPHASGGGGGPERAFTTALSPRGVADTFDYTNEGEMKKAKSLGVTSTNNNNKIKKKTVAESTDARYSPLGALNVSPSARHHHQTSVAPLPLSSIILPLDYLPRDGVTASHLQHEGKKNNLPSAAAPATTTYNNYNNLSSPTMIPNFSSTCIRIKKKKPLSTGLLNLNQPKNVLSNNLEYCTSPLKRCSNRTSGGSGSAHNKTVKIFSGPATPAAATGAPQIFGGGNDGSGVHMNNNNVVTSEEPLLREYYVLDSPNSNEIIIPILNLRRVVSTKVFFPTQSMITTPHLLSDSAESKIPHCEEDCCEGSVDDDDMLIPAAMIFNKKFKSKSVPADHSTPNFTLVELREALNNFSSTASSKNDPAPAENECLTKLSSPKLLISHNYVINNAWIHTQIKCNKPMRVGSPHSSTAATFATPDDSGKGTSEPSGGREKNETSPGRSLRGRRGDQNGVDIDPDSDRNKLRVLLHPTSPKHQRIYSSNETGYIDITLGSDDKSCCNPINHNHVSAKEQAVARKKTSHLPRRTKSTILKQRNSQLLPNNVFGDSENGGLKKCPSLSTNSSSRARLQGLQDKIQYSGGDGGEDYNYNNYYEGGESLSTHAWAESSDIYNNTANTVYNDHQHIIKPYHQNLPTKEIQIPTTQLIQYDDDDYDLEQRVPPLSPDKSNTPTTTTMNTWWDKVKIDPTPKNLYSRRMKHNHNRTHISVAMPAQPPGKRNASLNQDNLTRPKEGKVMTADDYLTIRNVTVTNTSITTTGLGNKFAQVASTPADYHLLRGQQFCSVKPSEMHKEPDFFTFIAKKRQSLPLKSTINSTSLLTDFQKLHTFVTATTSTHNSFNLNSKDGGGLLTPSGGTTLISSPNCCSSSNNIKDKIALFNSKFQRFQNVDSYSPTYKPMALVRPRLSKPELLSPPSNNTGKYRKIIRSKSFANPSQ